MTAAAREWAARESQARPDVVRVGYFGSYARNDWGVGSDLDLIAIVDHPGAVPFDRRAAEWDVTGLPVPADLLVYTLAEWRGVIARDDRFSRMLRHEVVWLVDRLPPRGQEP